MEGLLQKLWLVGYKKSAGEVPPEASVGTFGEVGPKQGGGDSSIGGLEKSFRFISRTSAKV